MRYSEQFAELILMKLKNRELIIYKNDLFSVLSLHPVCQR